MLKNTKDWPTNNNIYLNYLCFRESLYNVFSIFVFTLGNSKLINSAKEENLSKLINSTKENLSKLINYVKEGNLSEVIDAILKGVDVNATHNVSYVQYLILNLRNKTVSLNGFLDLYWYIIMLKLNNSLL